MLNMSESSVFQSLDQSAGISKQISAIVNNKIQMKRITTELDDVFTKMYNQYKNVATERAIGAFRDGRIMICYSEDPKFNLPVCVPFFKYAKDGKVRVVINVTNYLKKSKIPNTTDQFYYDMKPTQLYTLLVSAYLFLDVFTPNAVLSNNACKMLSSVWSNMALKPLTRYLALKNNRDKFLFYRYAFAKFFCVYYLGITDKVAAEIAESAVGLDTHNPFVIEFESLDTDGTLYTDYNKFMHWILSPKFTSIKSGKIVTKVGVSGEITPSLYLKLFIDTFDFINVGCLMSVPYFMFTLLGTSNKAFFGGDRAFEDVVFGDTKASVPKIVLELVK